MRRTPSPFTTIRSEGALLPPEVLTRIADADGDLGGLSPTDYHLGESERLGEAISRSWNRLVGVWASFAPSLDGFTTNDPGTGATRERWLAPLFQELAFGRLQVAKAKVIDGVDYPISHEWDQVPVHLVGTGVELDRRTKGVAGAAKMSPHALVQDFLNRTESLWGIVSNGRELRVLRDNVSLTRQAYLAFDLESIFSGEVYADFALLWLLCHESRFEPQEDRIDRCWLERWTQAAQAQGTRALNTLREGVERAILTLGAGFLGHSSNAALREALRSGELATADYYRELLRLIYRLIFLFVSEDRALLHPDPTPEEARTRYHDFYSTTRLRRIAERLRGGPHPDLWRGFVFVCSKLALDDGCLELGLPYLGGSLFSALACPHLDEGELANRDLLAAIRALAFTEQHRALRQIDYRNMGSEELGSIYESLLELHPEVHHESGTFELGTAGGNERKTTGSYYTPTSLISALLDIALDPVLEEAAKNPDPETAILDLKVLDPACGSGHFLVAAAHRIAKRLAAIRTDEPEPSPGAYRHALRDVIGRCIFGIDVNPMATELCKVSLWMEAVEPGKPLSFLDHHIMCGNSLLGTTPKLLTDGIPDEAFNSLEGDDKEVVKSLKKRNKEERKGQAALFGEAAHPDLVAPITKQIAELEAQTDGSPGAVKDKERKWVSLLNSEEAVHAKFIADAWCAAFVIDKTKDAPVLTQGVFEQLERTPPGADSKLHEAIAQLAVRYRFLHPHLAFPQVFHAPSNGEELDNPEQGWSGGFDVVVGNPPFLNQLESGTAVDRHLAAVVAARLAGEVRGYTDVSAQFLAFSADLAATGGRVALVQPQSILAARDAGVVRSHVLRRAAPCFVWVAGVKLFEASVLVCSVCLMFDESDPVTIRRAKGAGFDALEPQLRTRAELLTMETWSPLIPEAFGGHGAKIRGRGTLDDMADATADFRDQFYGLIPFVYEGQEAANPGDPPLITTGLIDPATCLWGNQTTRFAKRQWHYPRVNVARLRAESDLGDWVDARLVPKVLVATQTRVLEAIVDLDGEWLPSIPTVSVIADRAELSLIAALLVSPPVTAWALESYGGTALATEAIKLSAKQIRSIPLPTNRPAWETGGHAFHLASAARSEGERRAHLFACASAMCEAYDVDIELVEWWISRLPTPRSKDEVA